VVVVNTDLTTSLRASKVNLDFGGKVSLNVASRDGNPVVITDKLVPVTLTSILAARCIGHIAVSGQTIVIVRKRVDTNSIAALSVDHGNLLVNLKDEGTSAASKSSHKDPVVSTRLGCPLDLGSTVARW